MKRSLLLSMAAYAASATQLRGDYGIEEVGEQIENFPPDEYDMTIDRRILTTEEYEEERMAMEVMEEYYDEYPDMDVVGTVVEEPEDDEFDHSDEFLAFMVSSPIDFSLWRPARLPRRTLYLTPYSPTFIF